MRKEFEQRLLADFPHVFCDMYGDQRKTSMAWGITCGDGWFDLIREAAEKIEKVILAMPEEERKHYKFAQCKEKFGTVRLYMSNITEEISDIIQEAETKSAITCEHCGRMPAKLRKNKRWWVTECDICVLLR